MTSATSRLGDASGRPHEIEIWFALDGRTLYLLSGGGDRSDWVRNLLAEPAVTVRLRDTTYAATARVVEGGDESERGRGLVFEKYQPRYTGSLERWRRESLWSRSTCVGQTDAVTISLVPLCTATITLADPLVLPNTPSGTRIIVEVIDAVYEGERLSGKHKGVAAADWMTVGPEGTGTLDVRATLETHDGALRVRDVSGPARSVGSAG